MAIHSLRAAGRKGRGGGKPAKAAAAMAATKRRPSSHAGAAAAATAAGSKALSRKPTTHRGRRLAKARAPQVVEKSRAAVLLKGASSSATVNTALTELASLLKPTAKRLTRKNPLLPFEAGGEEHVCSLARLNDASVFIVGSHTKKRPDTLTLGRTFDGHVLDMVELGIRQLVPMVSFRRAGSQSVAPETKPCLIFQGDDWERSPATSHLRSLLLDTFRGPLVEAVNLAGLDRLLVFTLAPPDSPADMTAASSAAAASGKEPPVRVYLRHYSIQLVRSTSGGATGAAASSGDPSVAADAATASPTVALSELGPRIDLVTNRAQWASDDLRRAACKGPRHTGAARKIKNVTYDTAGIGDTLGRLHVERQDLGTLALTRTKALGNRRRNARWQEGAAGDDVEGDAPDVEGGGGRGNDRNDNDDDAAAAEGGRAREEISASGGGMDMVDEAAA
ncbi:hypothetical protein MMPV_006122 [Pyropia vietnamensis]